MKKKVILSASMLLALTFSIYSCKKNISNAPASKIDIEQPIHNDQSNSFQEVDISKEKIYSILNSELLMNKLGILGMNYTGKFKKLTKLDSDIFVCELKGLAKDITSSSLIVYSSANCQIILPLLFTSAESNVEKTYRFLSLDQQHIISELQLVLNGDVGWDVPNALPCPQQGLSFSDCVVCAWADVCSDWIGLTAATTNPGAVLIACVTACLFFSSALPPDPDFAEVQEWVENSTGPDNIFNGYDIVTSNSLVTFVLN